jgi:hypothetical protein
VDNKRRMDAETRSADLWQKVIEKKVRKKERKKSALPLKDIGYLQINWQQDGPVCCVTILVLFCCFQGKHEDHIHHIALDNLDGLIVDIGNTSFLDVECCEKIGKSLDPIRDARC